MVIDSLVKSASHKLDRVAIALQTFYNPNSPTCIFYFGDRSKLFHKELYGDVSRLWGESTNFVSFVSVSDNANPVFTDEVNNVELSDKDLQSLINKNAISGNEIFKNHSSFYVYCVLDTSDITDVEEFKKWYSVIEHFKENIFVGADITSMLMLILNEDFTHVKNTQNLRSTLANDIYASSSFGQANSHLYDSVVCISNIMSGGQQVELDPSSENYTNFNLLADLIIVSNTRETASINESINSALYRRSEPFVTVAYSYEEKPKDAIALHVLKSMIDALADYSNRIEQLDADSLAAAIGIKSNESKLLDDLYGEIKQKLPKADIYRYLPNCVSFNGDNYGIADERSKGCLSRFVVENNFSVVDEKVNEKEIYIKSSIVDMISGSINAAKLSKGINGKLKSDLYSVKIKGPFSVPVKDPDCAVGYSSKESVRETVIRSVKLRIAEKMTPIIDERLDFLLNESQKIIINFNNLTHEIARKSAVCDTTGIKEGIAEVYSRIVKSYFDRDLDRLERLANKVFRIGITEKQMIDVLLEELDSVFAFDPIFELDFIGELVERIRRNADNVDKASEMISQAMTLNMSDRVMFRSVLNTPRKACESFLINGSDEELKKSLEGQYLDPGVSRVFFNTYSNDRVESLWFFVGELRNL